MTDSFRAAEGRKVVSRATAETVGVLRHLIIDAAGHQIVGLVVKEKRRSLLVDWEHVNGFGVDAVMVESEAVLRAPADDREHAAVKGTLDLVGKRALSEMGNERGSIVDVEFDPGSGVLGSVLIGDDRVPATVLLGVGSYAAVLASKAVAET